MTTTDLLVNVLVHLVESVPDQPRRVLFKGVSALSDAFKARVEGEGKRWDVRITRAGEDVVGARNDVGIPTLVVFYRDEVRERESLNAFRLFDEDAIAEALVRHAVESDEIAEQYTSEEVERLRLLLDLVYPSAERLAAFLLAGKEKVGT